MEPQITPPTGPIKTNRIEEAKKTYFFERHDGSIIHVQESEAHQMLKNRQTIVGQYVPPPKLIGVGNGVIFQKAVLEAHALHQEGRTEEALARLRQGEKDELEAARGHIERPRNFDAIDQYRRPIDIGGLK